ncbi:insulinase family protein [Lentibacter algarum]|uniref:M16 family metallopeptidase n=1 Tax=Lentibacter algarum TaxID=576131 RepID=UPI001C08E5D9|nr:pitrilysin family protein [Lentibacter algarum]MBU2982958.1 insulinase family protein [Lentibacter algarum]
MSIQTHSLPNGFRIVTERMPSLKSASVGVWVTAGGRNERVEQNGIAHFLEHMAFKGTAKRSSLEIAEVIENVGGYINAYTSRETTAYYARVLAEDVNLSIDVIADILLNPLFEQKEIDVERGVILQEIGQALDTPDDVIFDWLQEQSYPDQPLGRTILGPAERVNSFTEADLRQFVSEHYGPGNMILAAAGDVNHDEIVAQATELFGHMPASQSPSETPALFQGGERRVVKDLEQAHFALAFEGPNYRDDAIFTAQLYASVLGGGMSSRLFQEVREKRGLCYTIFAQAGAYGDTGMMTIYAGTSGDQLGQLAEVTLAEMARAASDINDNELARARAQMKAGMLMGLESPSNRAERLARMVQIWGRVPDISEVVQKVEAVSTADVRAMAAHMARDARSSLALYGPVENAPSLQNLRQKSAA